MSKLISENLVVYKIRSKKFDEESVKKNSIFLTGAGGPVYCIFQKNSENSKVLEKISKEKINIDKLFSPDTGKLKELDNLLPNDASYEVPLLSKQEIRKDVKDSFKDILVTDMNQEVLERYAKEILKLSKARKTFTINKPGIEFLSQLTEEGWISSSQIYPKADTIELREYTARGLVKTKTFEGSQLYFVKLTKKGKTVQQDILERYKKSSKLPEAESHGAGGSG